MKSKFSHVPAKLQTKPEYPPSLLLPGVIGYPALFMGSQAQPNLHGICYSPDLTALKVSNIFLRKEKELLLSFGNSGKAGSKRDWAANQMLSGLL